MFEKFHREKFEETLGKHAGQKQELEQKQAEEIQTLKAEAEAAAYRDKERLEELRAEMADITGAKENSAKPEQNENSFESLKKDWQDFYQETFGIESDFSKIEIPEKQEGFERLIVMEKGMTAQKLFDKCKELFFAWKYTEEDLDKIIKSDRSAEKEAYAVWIREGVEADEELKNLSANDIEKKGIKTETLEERLLDEIRFFKKKGKHLDMKNLTLCSGSRNSDGFVPDVHWRDYRMEVTWSPPGYHRGDLRARQAVS
ncbi:MAG TPA: hypothetical protein PKW17_13750 [Smithellaceae bacterium]|jgi:hypothetical protein|nr:hypothetical protein [Smithellaceae bacterium]HRS90382.1 hypothetical protein [Smithellaceae bacterium]